MKTNEFNENYEIDRKANGVKAMPKNGHAEAAAIRTADGEVYDPGETYYFFDSQRQQIRQSTSLRLAGEHLCSLGLKVVAVANLRANKDDAISAGQSFFKSEIERLQKRIEKLELEKTGERRKLKEFSIVNK